MSMKKINTEYCKRCYFWTTVGNGNCDRYLMLGKGYRRECPIGMCDKFLRKGATEEELEENKKLNKSAPTYEDKEQRVDYHNYYFGKGAKNDIKRVCGSSK